MKATLIGITVAVIVLAIGAVAVGNVLGLWGSTPAPASTTVPNGPPKSSIPITIPPRPSTPPTSPAAVSFSMAISNISGTGLSRTVTAQVTNAGSKDAHNTWGKIEVFSAGQRVKLSSQDYARVDVGEIKAGTTVTAQTTLSFSLTDGLKIQQNGADVQLTITSDDGSQTLTYPYKP